MDRYNDEIPEFEYDPEDQADIDAYDDAYDHEHDLDDYRHGYSYSDRGFSQEEIRDLLDSQIITIEELEEWTKENDCE